MSEQRVILESLQDSARLAFEFRRLQDNPATVFRLGILQFFCDFS